MHGWIAGRTSAEVCKALHLPPGGDSPVSLLVLSRHVADFVGASEFDKRAVWLSWPKLAKIVSGLGDEGLVKRLKSTVGSARRERRNTTVNEYRLKDFVVEVRVN